MTAPDVYLLPFVCTTCHTAHDLPPAALNLVPGDRPGQSAAVFTCPTCQAWTYRTLFNVEVHLLAACGVRRSGEQDVCPRCLDVGEVAVEPMADHRDPNFQTKPCHCPAGAA